jgi:hypothetical protein
MRWRQRAPPLVVRILHRSVGHDERGVVNRNGEVTDVLGCGADAAPLHGHDQGGCAMPGVCLLG